MNCQDALELLYDIIDKEASDLDKEKVHQHLQHCKDCFDVYSIENKIQDFINAKLKDNSPKPVLKELKSRILDELDSIDKKLGDDKSC